MRKLIFIKTIVLLFIWSFQTDVSAAILNFQNSINGAAIYVGTPAVNFEKEENKFSLLPTMTGYVNASVKNKVSVGVDHSLLNYVGTGYHYRYKLLVETWNNNVPTPTTSNNIYLSVQYDPAATSNFRDLSTYSFTDGNKVKVTVLEIFDFNTSTLITNPPDNMFIKIDIEVERYYDLDVSTVNPTHTAYDLNGDSKDDQLVISWSARDGAEEYDLEWTYVDDYDAVLSTPKSLSSISWNFIGDNTRVTVKTTQYAINLTYDRGYIIYRVRSVGRKTVSPYIRVIAPWSKGDVGTDPSSGSCSTCYYHVNEHEDALNWQYSGTFAEEGKKKEVVWYFDGSLRNRQTVTINNTSNSAIVGECYYDYQGRKAVDALPVPTGNNALGYNPNFNVNVSLDRYSKLDFDVDGSSSCSSAIGTMSTTSGSSKYYSSSNPLNTGNNAFIPDAEQYPFSQVEYTPDNTGRIRRMGGVGPNHQLNTGHETKYYYGQPTQWELDRLFGSEVGYNNHYLKNMVIDPNGQISISYLDMHGRVVATALSGESPTNVIQLNSDEPANVTVDLLAKDANGNSLNNFVNAYFNSLTYQTQLLVSVPGEHTINYSLEMPQVTDSCLASSMCFDCIYDLKIEVRDECGNLVYQSDLIKVGTPTLNSSCGSVLTFSTAAAPIEVNLAIGNYQISKILTINEDAYNYYLSLYLTPEGNSCFVSYEDMLSQEMSLLNYDDCNFSCQRCVQALGSKDEYVVSGKGTEDDWLEAYNICMEPCRAVSPCEVMIMAMKSDMSPGGQYAEWYDSTIHAIQVRNFPLSILNEDNALPDGGVPSGSGGAYWRNPKLPDGTPGYFEEDGKTRTKINLIKNVDGTYTPSVINDTYVNGNATDGYYIYPEYLSNIEDFIGQWNSSWAMSLVVYHPEYCYNKWCIDHLEKRNNPGDLASYEFDDALDKIETYADAVSAGYIAATPTVHDLLDLDPYFQSISTSQASEMLAKCSAYVHYGTNDYTILELASMTAKCGSFYGDNFSTSCTSFGTGSTDELDRMWIVLKSLYIGAKQQLIKAAADDYTLSSGCKGYNKCIGLETYNPFSGRARTFMSSFWIDDYQACATSTYSLYKSKQKRFLIGDLDVNASQEDINFTYFNNTGKCPGEADLFALLNEIASKGELTSTHDLYTYQTYTPSLYEKISGSAPGGTYIEYETLPAITGSSSEKLSLDFRLKGTSTLYTCGMKFEFIANPNGYAWSDIVGFSEAKKISDDAVAGTSLYDIVVMVNDGISPDPVPFTIRGKICTLFSDCEFYDDCKPSDFAYSLQLLLSGLADGGNLTSTSAVNLETGYPNFLDRHIRDVIGGVKNANLGWIYNGTGSFTISDPVTTPAGSNINLQVTAYDPSSFTHSDLNKVKYFENLRIDPSDVEHGFIVDAWYEPSVGAPLQMVTITFSSDIGILARCFDPAPLNCKTPEFQAQRDLEILLSEVLVPFPSAETDLSSNNNYTDLLESFLGQGYAYLMKPLVTNDEAKGYIQVRDGTGSGANVLNQCTFKLFRLNEAFSFNDFNTIVSLSNLEADEMKMVDGKTFYFTVDVQYSNGIIEKIGGYTSCIPLMSCGCHKEVVTTCHNDYAAIIDLTSKYNANYGGVNPNSFSLDEMPAFSQFDCQCGKSYLDYLSNFTETETAPMNYLDFIKAHCIPSGDFCNEFQSYIEAVERYNALHPSSTVTVETNIPDENCSCIESYVDYIATFNSAYPLFATPPMSFSDYLANGCTFPALSDNCTTLLPTYGPAINAKINEYNTTVIPPSSSLPGAPLPSVTLTSSDCNCVVKYIALLDRYIMNGLSDPAIMSSFPAAPDFATFKANGCQGTCISEYFIYASTMEDNGITPETFDESRCGCYINYTNYFNDNNVNGVFMGLGLNDFCDNTSSMMMMAMGSGGTSGSGTSVLNTQDSMTNSETGGNQNLNTKTYGGGDSTLNTNSTVMTTTTESMISLESYVYQPKPRNPCCPPDTVNYPEIELVNSCFDYLDGVAEMIALSRYQAQVEYFTARFRETYLNKCMKPTETLTLQMPNYDYHYTLYYYDQGGNLLRTVPPAGISLITNSTDLTQINTDRTNDQRQVFTAHSLVTTYEYNSLNQLMRQNIPDNDLMDRWTVYNNSTGIPSGTSVKDIKFVDANVGYLIGNGSLGTELYRTTDGGLTFKPVSIQTSDLKKVKMLDASNGFAVGLDGLFFQTTDGGNYWKVIQIDNSTTPVTGTVNDFYFKSTSEGILVGNNGLCYHAYNSGVSWTFAATTGLGSRNLLSVDFESASTTTLGFVAIDNGGTAEIHSINSWPTTSSGAFTLSDISVKTKLKGVDINRTYFIDNNNGFAAGKDGQLLKTTDAGSTWTHLATNTVIEFRDIYFVDASNGLALAADGKFYSTSTGGTEWDAISALGVYRSMHIYDKASATKYGYAAGDDGCFAILMYQSGKGFRVFKQTFFTAVTTDFSSVFGLSGSELFVGGNSGYLAKIIRTGNDWSLTAITTSLSTDVKKLYFASNTLGLILDVNGNMKKVQFSGSWSVAPAFGTSIEDFDFNSSDFKFLEKATSGSPKVYTESLGNLSTGFFMTTSTIITGASYLELKNIGIINNTSDYLLTGIDGAIFRNTVNNSKNTQPLRINTIRAIAGSNTIFASGNDGTFIKTTDGGANWQTIATGTASDLFDMDAYGTSVVYMAGESGALVKYTGTSALLSPGTSENLYSVKRYGTNSVAAGGANKTLVYSSDAGAHFANIFLPKSFASDASVNALTAYSTTLYLTGGKGVIYKYSSGTFALTFNVPEQNNSIRIDPYSKMGLIACNRATVIVTEDLGQTWTLKPMIGSSTGLDIKTSWIFGKTNILLAGNTNWCRKWNYTANTFSAPTGLSTGAIFKDMAFNEKGQGFIIDDASGVSYSYNSGSSFVSSTLSGTLNSVDIEGPEAYIACDANVVYHYTGLTNSTPASPVSHTSTTTSTNFNRIVLLDRTLGYLIGNSGQIVKMSNPDLGTPDFYQEYSNTGSTNTGNNLYAVDFNKRGMLVLAGASGYVRTVEDDARTVSNIFWYDELGRLVVSQNSKQFNYSTPAYSYTQFDALGRITEVGEVESGSGPQDFMLVNNVQYSGIVTWIGGSSRRQVTQTYYDDAFAPTGAGITQVNLNNRIASITYEETYDGNNSTYEQACHFVYDIHGNIDILVQEIPALATYGSQFKKVRYEYDLVSGNLLEMHYNENELDQYHQRFIYDLDNRVAKVETSRDNLNWDVDATYQYYLHGPLMRAEIGDLKVQGIDFAYTLHGWIKGVNAGILDPDRDMGKDAKVSTGNLNQYVARDAFGYILGYYSDPASSVEDYAAINSSGTNHFAPNTSGSDLMNFRKNLYNSNITSMQTVLPNCSTYNASRTISSESFGNAYNYDQLNRIKSSRTFTNLNTTTNAWGNTGMVSQDFSTDYVYDANGNITNLTRWGNGTQMDEFSYNYNIQSGKMKSNRLYHVNDNVGLSSNYTDDIDDQGTFNSTLSTINSANNYGYDELGNLIRDNSEEIASIEWNSCGKILKINRTVGSSKPNIEYSYDAFGYRLSEKIILYGNVQYINYFIRDIYGNIISKYQEYNDIGGNQYFVCDFHVIYGIERLGLDLRKDTLYLNTQLTSSLNYCRILGNKAYDLCNYLGNTLVTISDFKKPKSSFGLLIDSYDPVILNINDFYPFGSNMNYRTWQITNENKVYGYNGMEKNNDNNYSTYFRQLDTRLGKWLSIDPDFSPNKGTYCSMDNNPIVYADPLGDKIIGSRKEKRELRKRPDWKAIRNRFQGRWFSNGKIYSRSNLDLKIEEDTAAPGTIYSARPQDGLLNPRPSHFNNNSREWHLYYHRDTIYETKTFLFNNKTTGNYVYPTTPLFTVNYGPINIGQRFHNGNKTLNEYINNTGVIVSSITLQSIDTKNQDYGGRRPAMYSFFNNGTPISLFAAGMNVLPAGTFFRPGLIMTTFQSGDMLSATGVWRTLNGKVDACNGFAIKLTVRIGKLRKSLK